MLRHRGGATRLFISIALLGTGACATAGGSAATQASASPAHRWRQVPDSLVAAEALANQGPRVDVYASFTTYGGTRQVRSSIRTQDDAYVLVGHIDGDGNLTVVYPGSPMESGFVRGGHSYLVPEFSAGFETNYAFRRRTNSLYSQTLAARYASYDGGTGYVFVIASWEPMEFAQLASGGRWARYTLDDQRDVTDPRGAVDQLAADLTGSAAGGYSVRFAHYFRSNYQPYLASASSYSSCGLGFGYAYGLYYSSFGTMGLYPYGNPGAIMDPFTGCTMYVPGYAYNNYGGYPGGWYPYSPRVHPYPDNRGPVTPGDTSARKDSIAYRARPGGAVILPGYSGPRDVTGAALRSGGWLLTGAPVPDSGMAPRHLRPRDLTPGMPSGSDAGRGRLSGSMNEPPNPQPRWDTPRERPRAEPRERPRAEPREPQMQPHDVPPPRQEPRMEPPRMEPPRIERPAPPPPRADPPRVEREKPPRG